MVLVPMSITDGFGLRISAVAHFLYERVRSTVS